MQQRSLLWLQFYVSKLKAIGPCMSIVASQLEELVFSGMQTRCAKLIERYILQRYGCKSKFEVRIKPEKPTHDPVPSSSRPAIQTDPDVMIQTDPDFTIQTDPYLLFLLQLDGF